MASLVQFSDAVNIGFHAMIELARVHPGSDRTKMIAKRLKVSEAHLAKVLQRLRQVGLITATRGPSGGYCLARPAASISLLEIFETIEGPMVPKFCLFGNPVCDQTYCGLGGVIGQINSEMKKFLSSTTLATVPELVGDVQFNLGKTPAPSRSKKS